MKILQKFHSNSSFVDTLLGVWIMKNDRGKNMRGKKRCQDWRENRPDSNTEPLRSLVQFVISRDILRHSPRDYYHFLVFPRANVSIFSLSWRNTLDRRKEFSLFVNTETERKSGHASHVSF